MTETDSPRELDIEYIKMAHAERLEASRGVREFSSYAIRMMYLLNGGAIIAILALIGNMYGKQTGDQSAIFTRFLHAIIPAFIPFITGLILAGVVSAFAYLNFSVLEVASFSSSDLLLWFRGQKLERHRFWRKAPQVTAIIGLVIGLFSLLAFAWGSCRVYQSFELLSRSPL
jgi:hypothetical protein